MANVLITINGDDQSTQAFNEAKDNFKSLSSTALTLGPAMVPVAAAATAAVGTLASTLGGAAVAASVFKLAVKPQMAAVQGAAEAQEKYNDAVSQYGEKSAQALQAQAALKQQMAGMPVATQETAKAFVGLKGDFEEWSNSLAGDTMPIFTKGIDVLRTVLPMLTPIVKGVSAELTVLMDRLKNKVESQGFEDFMKKLSAWAVGGLQKTISGIRSIHAAVKGFVMGDGFRQFFAMGQESGGNIGDILKKLAQFAVEFVKAAGPLASLSFLSLQVLAAALNAIPQSVLEVLAPTIMAIVVAMKAWQLAVIAYTAVQWLMNAAMTANPFGLIVLAIVALVAAVVTLWKKNEGFRNFIKTAWENIKEWVSIGIEFITNLFLNWTGPGLIIKHWDAIKKGISESWTKIKGWVSSGLSFIKNLFLNWTGPGLIIKHWSTIKTAAKGAVDWVRNKWNGLMSFFSSVPGRIRGALGNLGGLLKSAGKDLVRGLINGIKNMAGAAISAAKGVVGSAINAARSALKIGSPSKVFETIGEQTGQGFIIGMTGTKKQIDSMADKLMRSVTKAFSGSKSLKDDRIVAMLAKGNTRLQALAGQRDSIIKKIADARKFAEDTGRQAAEAFSLSSLGQGGEAGGVQALLAGGLDSIKKFAANIRKLQEKGLGKDLLRQLLEMGPVQGAALAQSMSDQDAAYIKNVNQLQDSVTKAGKNLGLVGADALYDSGKKAGDGFLAGLMDQQKKIEDLMLKIALGMQRSIRKALGIKSPSKVMAEVGRQSTAGLAKGLTENAPTVSRAVTSLSGDIVGGARGSLNGPSVSAPTQSQQPLVVQLIIGDKALGEVVIDPIRRIVRSKGGSVQAVLGS